MHPFPLIALLAPILLPVAGFTTKSQAATETPDYKVERQDGDFEIRVYPDLKLVTTSSEDSEMNGSFMTLFRYIDGGNEAEQKIAMTSPVLMTKGSDASTMSFIVPKDVAVKGAPAPANQKISLTEMPAMRVATYRYSGRTNAKKEQEALAKLQQWMKQQNLTPNGEPLYAGYNPPWTLGFMRRNEVLIPLAAAK